MENKLSKLGRFIMANYGSHKKFAKIMTEKGFPIAYTSVSNIIRDGKKYGLRKFPMIQFFLEQEHGISIDKEWLEFDTESYNDKTSCLPSFHNGGVVRTPAREKLNKYGKTVIWLSQKSGISYDILKSIFRADKQITQEILNQINTSLADNSDDLQFVIQDFIRTEEKGLSIGKMIMTKARCKLVDVGVTTEDIAKTSGFSIDTIRLMFNGGRRPSEKSLSILNEALAYLKKDTVLSMTDFDRATASQLKNNAVQPKTVFDNGDIAQNASESSETEFVTGNSDTDALIRKLRRDEYLKIGFMTNYPALFPDKDFDKVLGDYCMQLYFFKQRITDYKHLFNSFRNFLNKKYQYQGNE